MSENRRPTPEEEDYNDAIERELDEWDEMIFGMQIGHIPGGWFGSWDPELAAYVGPSPGAAVKAEGDTSSSPEDWKEFLRKIEEDLDG